MCQETSSVKPQERVCESLCCPAYFSVSIWFLCVARSRLVASHSSVHVYSLSNEARWRMEIWAQNEARRHSDPDFIFLSMEPIVLSVLKIK